MKVFTMTLRLMLMALIFTFLIPQGHASETLNGFKLSDMYVKITSNGQTAEFRLYDTTAAKEFYSQLPLKLELHNFRQAQWMFYPPNKLNVKPDEAYHDGKKGELSYYAPWGDVFMLYKDFYAGDEMHRLGINVSGMNSMEKMSGSATIEKVITSGDKNMKISVTSNGRTTVFSLNDSTASKELYAQLPLNIKVEDYGGIEKIFYPPKKLGTSNTPRANAKDGSLSYYAPWGDVVMFYEDFGSASGLYELGDAISGAEYISGMSGTVRIEKSE